MVDWAAGYTASWRVMRVNPVTWADEEELPGVTSISVERTNEQLRESGSAEVTLDVGEDFPETWCRIEMLATQGAESQRVALATLQMAPTDSDPARGREAVTLEGRSVLAPASDEVLLAGTYAPKGADGAAHAARMLSCCNAPVIVHGSFTLGDHVVFAGGTTRLEAAWMLLDAANWTIVIDGDGTINVMPKPTEPTLDLDAANVRMLITVPKREFEVFSIKNRYIAVMDDQQAIAVNDDPDDPTSYARRGRYVDEYEENPTLIDGENLQAYANRRLSELSKSTESKSYDREWWPNVTIDSIVRGGIASVRMVGDLRVTNQTLSCGRGVVVTEVAEVI